METIEEYSSIDRRPIQKNELTSNAIVQLEMNYNK